MKYAIISVVTGETIRYGDAENPEIQPVKEGEEVVVVPDASVDLSHSKLNIETGLWEPFDPARSPRHLEIAAQMDVAKQNRMALSSPFLALQRQYIRDELRFVEVALVGGNLMCDDSTGMKFMMHTPQEGMIVLAAFVAVRNKIEAPRADI